MALVESLQRDRRPREEQSKICNIEKYTVEMRIAVDGIINRLDLISEIVCKFENVSVEINRGKRGLKNKHPCQVVMAHIFTPALGRERKVDLLNSRPACSLEF